MRESPSGADGGVGTVAQVDGARAPVQAQRVGFAERWAEEGVGGVVEFPEELLCHLRIVAAANVPSDVGKRGVCSCPLNTRREGNLCLAHARLRLCVEHTAE